MVVAASTIAFVLLHVAPGDPFDSIGQGMTPKIRAELRARWGLDKPLAQQYVTWLKNAATGDLGRSTRGDRPVGEMIASRLPNTLLLMGLALVGSIGFGIALGAWQGAHAGTRSDRVLSTLSLSIYSIPEFWLALTILLLFAQSWQLLPSGDMVSPTDYAYKSTTGQLLDRLWHLAGPWATLTLVGTSVFARFQRTAMRDAMSEPFVRTARAKGLQEFAVRRHALRASLLPVIAVGGLLFPALVGGAVLVEQVFSWPGIGRLMLEAVGARDYQLVTGLVLVVSAMTALGALLADVLRVLADPRVVQS